MDARSMCLGIGLFVLAASISAGEAKTNRLSVNDGGERYEVEFEEEIRFHRTERGLGELCRSLSEVRGCTDFPEERLECRCVPYEGGWVINATARLRAEIHVSTPKVLVHERQHLADLRASLENHLSDVLRLTYPERNVCSMKAKIMSTPQYLRDLMNRFRAESNRKFRC